MAEIPSSSPIPQETTPKKSPEALEKPRNPQQGENKEGENKAPETSHDEQESLR